MFSQLRWRQVAGRQIALLQGVEDARRLGSIAFLLMVGGHQASDCDGHVVRASRQECRVDAKPAVSTSFAAVALEGENGAGHQINKRDCRENAGGLNGSNRDGREPGGKQYSRKTAKKGDPADNGHEHRPASFPPIVRPHDGKSGNEQGKARHEDKCVVTKGLLHQGGPDAQVQQNSGGSRHESGADQARD